MLTSARNPFEVVMIFAGLLAGIAGLLVPEGERVEELYGVLPPNAPGFPPNVPFFHACLVIGTGTVAVSLFLKPPMAQLIERVGMIWLAALFLSYGVALTLVVSFGFHPIWVLILGYGLACAARILQITHDLRSYRRGLRRLTGDSQ